MIIFAADLHICRNVWANRRDLEGDSFRSLFRLQEAVLNLHSAADPASVILGGDIFDSQKIDGATLEPFKQFCQALAAAGVSVYFVQGNHDRGLIPIPQIEGAISLDHNPVDIPHGPAPVRVYGLDWMPKKALLDTMKVIPECDFLVLHCSFHHLLGFDHSDMTIGDIPPQAKNVLVGDVHTTDITPIHNGKGVCVSPGPIHPCTLSQDGPHGFQLLRGGSTKWEFVPISSRRVYRFFIAEPKDLEELEKFSIGTQGAEVSEHLEPLVEVQYLASLWPEVEALIKPLSDKIILFTKKQSDQFVDFDDPEVLRKLREEASTLTLSTSINAVVEATEFNNKPKLEVFVTELLTAEDPRDVIQKEFAACGLSLSE